MRGRKKASPKLYYIEWTDPATEHAGWFELNKETLDKLEPVLCKSVGWLIKENKDYIVVAGSLIEKENMASCDVSIPKGLIKIKQELIIDGVDK
jgi:hypothetical protein|tara:strand:- start:315 stop:596 length:282 start_codon:yes stop_codon:yes gene_type:complete